MEPTIEERYWQARKDARTEYGPDISYHSNALLDYAKLAVRSAIILNGGALFVLPAYVGSIVGQIDIDNAKLTIAALSFVTGILLAVTCSFVAYLNYGYHMTACTYQYQIRLNAIEEHYDVSSKIRMAPLRQEHFKALSSNIDGLQHRIDVSWKLGIATGIGSYAAFIIGCFFGGLVMLNGI